MRIGLDLSVLSRRPWTGIGKYAWNLAVALTKLKTNHEFVFFACSSAVPFRNGTKEGANEIAAFLSVARNDNVEIINLPSKRIPFWSSHITYANIMKRARLDVLHGPANSLSLFFKGSNGSKGTKVVITIHDLAIYKHPEWFPRGQWFATKVLVPRAIKKADAIIVPSQATKRDLLELFSVGEGKIHVIPLGVEERFFRKNAPPPTTSAGRREEGQGRLTPSLSPPHEGEKFGSHYILFVGTLEPRKNVGRLIEAYRGLPDDIRREYELWVAGATPSLSPPISLRGTGGEKGTGFSPSRRAGGEQEGVRFLSYVPDEDLPTLYQNASVLVYPSLYEGFGLPVLEGLAAGVPVITSRQVAGNFQLSTFNFRLELVNPYSVAEIRDAIIRLVRDGAYLSEKLARGTTLARQLTWEKTAGATIEAYRQA